VEHAEKFRAEDSFRESDVDFLREGFNPEDFVEEGTFCWARVEDWILFFLAMEF
jgi:hypothetical protein